MEKNSIVDKNKIYAVKMTNDKSATGTAMYIAPDYCGFKGICYLNPGCLGHMIEGKLGKKPKTGFTL